MAKLMTKNDTKTLMPTAISTVSRTTQYRQTLIKGELIKPWQKVAVRWFVLYNNERNSPSFQPILRDFKVIVIYLKSYLLLNMANLA